MEKSECKTRMQFQKKNQECFTRKIRNKPLCFAFKLRYHKNKDNLANYSDLTELNSGGALPKLATSLYFIFKYLLYSIFCILTTMGVILYSQK